jgi:hypothetical protein
MGLDNGVHYRFAALRAGGIDIYDKGHGEFLSRQGELKTRKGSKLDCGGLGRFAVAPQPNQMVHRYRLHVQSFVRSRTEPISELGLRANQIRTKAPERGQPRSDLMSAVDD